MGAQKAVAQKAGTQKKDGCCAASAESLCSLAKNLCSSWDKAQAEYSALSVARRGEILASVQKLSGRLECVKLLPETISTLTEGVALLTVIDAELQKILDESPEIAGSAPEGVLDSYRAQVKLIGAANEVLKRVRATFQKVNGLTVAGK